MKLPPKKHATALTLCTPPVSKNKKIFKQRENAKLEKVTLENFKSHEELSRKPRIGKYRSLTTNLVRGIVFEKKSRI